MDSFFYNPITRDCGTWHRVLFCYEGFRQSESYRGSMPYRGDYTTTTTGQSAFTTPPAEKLAFSIERPYPAVSTDITGELLVVEGCSGTGPTDPYP